MSAERRGGDAVNRTRPGPGRRLLFGHGAPGFGATRRPRGMGRGVERERRPTPPRRRSAARCPLRLAVTASADTAAA
jgi:hypothetical protein